MPNLEVHHKEFRSHSGDDSELNLITLCTFCHAQTHGRAAGSDNKAKGKSVES
jgi:5-methylcytosine-specific restriction endonuclease McrA